MEQEQWLLLEMLVLLGYNLKIVVEWRDWHLKGGGIVLGGGGMSKFSAGWWGTPTISPPISPLIKTLH